MKTISMLLLALAVALSLAGCGKSDGHGGTHTHADGSTHGDHAHDDHADDDHAQDAGGAEDEHDHAHDEVALETVTIGDMAVELAQGHGAVAAGMEGHLVVKLPYNDNGATTVRAWIGGADRTLSMVGLGEYAASHDDYDIHAMAPSPLPADTMWWIEIEKPDGTKVVGSAEPIME